MIYIIHAYVLISHDVYHIDLLNSDTNINYRTPITTQIIQSDQFNVSGIVGASYSSNSKIAAHASTMYEIPMISYQSSATSISDTYYFPFLFRWGFLV